MELSTLPEHVVVETTEHKCLQSHFLFFYNEAMQLKTQLEETRSQLQIQAKRQRRPIRDRKLRKDLDDSKAAEIRVLQQIKKLQEQQQSLNSSHDPDSGDTKVKKKAKSGSSHGQIGFN
ncbi:hypothetical protein TCAL_17364 [Tigriopus californicus]|uniref:Uncharacterized protein n=1 Tax=Tigriopus californicus TaxID=6832 RepID=A0A553PBL8_TIGCA|nr:hypothetical protein TCAL_17364 [Tigriopus californicus]